MRGDKMSRLIKQFRQTKYLLTAWIVFLVVLIGVGMYGAVRFTGRSEPEAIPWGLLVPSYIFFALAATGTSLINSISTVFQVERFKPIIKRDIWLSLILIVPAGIFILLDLGRTSHAYNLYLFFHDTSRLAWMGMLYLIFVFFLVIQLIGAIREERMPRWSLLAVGIIVLVATLAVEANLGALFGAVEAKPFWNSPVLPLHFIVSALMVGVCLQIIFTSVSYAARKAKMSAAVRGLFSRDYRPLLAGLIVINFLVLAAKFIPESMSADAAPYVKLLIAGPYSASFWGVEIVIGGVIPLVILLSSKTRQSAGWLLTASALVTIGVFFSKYDLIVAGQSIGPTFIDNFIPYVPSVYEILTVIGGVAACLLLYTFGELLLPLEPEEEPSWFIFAPKESSMEPDVTA